MEGDPNHRLLAAIESGNRKFLRIEALRRLSEEPENFYALCSVAFEHLADGRLEECEQCARTILSRDSDEESSMGWYLLSRCAHARNEMAEAVTCVYRAFGLAFNCNWYFSWAALYHLVRKEYPLALSFANKVLRQDPEDVMTLGIQALAAYLDGGILATEEHLDSILAIEPENPVPYHYRGRLEQERKRHDRARFWFGKALELEPEFLWSQQALSTLETRAD
ncbi:MAG: hypothetical protein KC800_09750 [Candidatus Eremiobacteraeota bacterium]|nr:hypothetical protein [Candidatus Eremiobacteraeota bacterium]